MLSVVVAVVDARQKRREGQAYAAIWVASVETRDRSRSTSPPMLVVLTIDILVVDGQQDDVVADTETPLAKGCKRSKVPCPRRPCGVIKGPATTYL